LPTFFRVPDMCFINFYLYSVATLGTR
jgi:hypothetical protein